MPATKAAHTSAMTLSPVVDPARETATALWDKLASTTLRLDLVADPRVSTTAGAHRAIRRVRGVWSL